MTTTGSCVCAITAVTAVQTQLKARRSLSSSLPPCKPEQRTRRPFISERKTSSYINDRWQKSKVLCGVTNEFGVLLRPFHTKSSVFGGHDHLCFKVLIPEARFFFFNPALLRRKIGKETRIKSFKPAESSEAVGLQLPL